MSNMPFGLLCGLKAGGTVDKPPGWGSVSLIIYSCRPCPWHSAYNAVDAQYVFVE